MGYETVEGYRVHPAASLFPLMQGAEFDRLVKSVKDNGLRVPMTVFNDMLLDGRNRMRACVAAGVAPKFTHFEGGDPVAHVIALNLDRRNLSEAQRSMIAAKLANLGEGRPAKETASIAAVSQDTAADLMNVSRGSVQRARKVIESGVPEAIEAVERGALAVSGAASLAELNEDRQRDVLREAGGDMRRVGPLARRVLGETNPAPAARYSKSRVTDDQRAADETIRVAWEGDGGRSPGETAKILGITANQVQHALTRMGLNTQARRPKDPLRGLVENARSAAFSWEQLSRGGPWEMATDEQRAEAIEALEDAKKRASGLIRKMRNKSGHVAA